MPKKEEKLKMKKMLNVPKDVARFIYSHNFNEKQLSLVIGLLDIIKIEKRSCQNEQGQRAWF